MSGICGWFATATPAPSAPYLDAMAAVLSSPLTRHRAHAVTGASGLATMSREAACGNLFQDGALWVAFEGTPYFTDPTLQAHAANHGMAAAIGECYRRRGTACLDSLHGAFAVAVLDHAARRVLLAVDRLGIRPLCLHAVNGGIVFGTTADSILAHPAVSRHIDPQSIYHYLYFHMIPSPGTIYRGMQKLLPAEYALFEEGRLTRRFYWEMRYVDTKIMPQAQLAKEFRALLRQTVRQALSTPHAKAGNFLSGGTDSSTLAGIVTEVTGTPADTYSIGFDAPGYDESHYADMAARHFGTRHHHYYVTPRDVVTAIPLIARAYDEPFGNASAVPTYFCAKMAQEDGVDLMVAGDGGDELFGGNARYVKQRTFELYAGIPAPVRRALVEPLALGVPGAGRIAPLRKLQSYIRQARIPLPDRLESYNFLHRSPLHDIFQPAFLASLDLEGPLENMREVYRRSRSTAALHHMLHLDLKNTLADNDLRKVNRMCEVAGTAVSYPLLDDAMVEFSGRVPPGLKIKGATLRYFFKESLKDFLPPEIINKTKHGFGLPFGLWLNDYPPLRELAYDSLQGLRRRDYINPAYIDTLLTKQHREHAGYYGVMVWVLMMLEQWLQHRHS